MMNIAAVILILLLTAVGFAELLRRLLFRETRGCTALPLTLTVEPLGPEDCEPALRAAAQRVRWLSWQGQVTLLCRNSRGDPEIDEIVRRFRADCPFLRIETEEKKG